MMRNQIKIYSKGLDNHSLSFELITSFLDSFWNEVLSNLTDDQVVSVLFKLEYDNKTIRSFSKNETITKDNKFKALFLDNIKYYYDSNIEHYEDLQADSLIIEYIVSTRPLSHDSFQRVRDILLNIKVDDRIAPDLEEGKLKNYELLPKTMDLHEWHANIRFNPNCRSGNFIQGGLIYEFDVFKKYYTCTISLVSNRNIIFKLKDTVEHTRLGLSNFTRIIYSPGPDNKWDYQLEKSVFELGLMTRSKKSRIERKFIRLTKKDKR
jgi:hypothetical protein